MVDGGKSSTGMVASRNSERPDLQQDARIHGANLCDASLYSDGVHNIQTSSTGNRYRARFHNLFRLHHRNEGHVVISRSQPYIAIPVNVNQDVGENGVGKPSLQYVRDVA